jgi:hypothetical protein
MRNSFTEVRLVGPDPLQKDSELVQVPRTTRSHQVSCRVVLLPLLQACVIMTAVVLLLLLLAAELRVVSWLGNSSWNSLERMDLPLLVYRTLMIQHLLHHTQMAFLFCRWWDDLMLPIIVLVWLSLCLFHEWRGHMRHWLFFFLLRMSVVSEAFRLLPDLHITHYAFCDGDYVTTVHNYGHQSTLLWYYHQACDTIQGEFSRSQMDFGWEVYNRVLYHISYIMMYYKMNPLNLICNVRKRIRSTCV